jgi:hypothetical protein
MKTNRNPLIGDNKRKVIRMSLFEIYDIARSYSEFSDLNEEFKQMLSGQIGEIEGDVFATIQLVKKDKDILKLKNE